MRAGYRVISRLGFRRKKKQKYRKATGIDNKVRLKMKGHLRNVDIGFRKEKKNRGLIQGLKPITIHNLSELKNLKKDEIGILARVGGIKKLEIANYIIENKIRLLNFNPAKFLKKRKRILDKLKEEKTKKIEEEDKKRLEEIEKKKKEEEKKEAEKKDGEKKEEIKIENEEVKEQEKEIKLEKEIKKQEDKKTKKKQKKSGGKK